MLRKKTHPDSSRKNNTWLILALLVAPLCVSNSFASVIRDNLKTVPKDYSAPIVDLESGTNEAQENLTNILHLASINKHAQMLKNAEEYARKYPNSSYAQELLGIAYFEAQEFDSSVKAFEAAIKLNEQRSELYTNKGIALMQLDELESAEISFNSALKINEQDRVAHQHLGMIYEYQNKLNLAIQHYIWALQYGPDDYIGIAVNLANQLNKKGRYQEAIQALATRLNLSSEDKVGHLILGTSYLYNKQFDKAMERFRRIVEIDEESIEAQLSLSMTLRKANQFEEALEISSRLVKQHPENGEAYIELGLVNMGLNNAHASNLAFQQAKENGVSQLEINRWKSSIFLGEKNFEAAKNLYKESIKEGTAEPSSYVLLSEILMSEQKYAEGEDILKAAVKEFDQSSYLNFRLGAYLATLRKYEQAIPYFQKANELQPNTSFILLSTSNNYYKAGDVDNSIKFAKQLYDLNQNVMKYALFYALKLEKDDKKTNEAITVYKGIIDKSPENVIALNNLASVLAKKGQLVEAYDYAKTANELVKNNAHLKDTLGWIYYLQGNFEKAEVILTQAAELSPQSGTILFHKGATLAKLDKKAASKSALEKALTLNVDGDSEAKIKELLASM